jgi:hypothetical protein
LNNAIQVPDPIQQELVPRLCDLLDNLPGERELLKRLGTQARQAYDWANLAPPWRQLFRESEDRIPMMAEDNPSMRRIFELVRRKKRVSKAEILKHLGWAPKQRALSWTAFRRRLQLIACDDPTSSEAIFELNGNN